MKSQASIIRAGAICAGVASFILIGMMVIGRDAAEIMTFFGQPGTPEQYAAGIQPAADVLIQVMALDNIFLIAYTGSFIGAASLLWEKARLFGIIGLGFAILLALLDVAENSVTVDIARSVIRGVPIPAWEIPIVGVLEQVKYASGTLALVFFAVGLFIALPQSRYARVVAGLFLFFPVTNALKVVGSHEVLLILWMFMMLATSAVLLWRESQLR